MDVKTMIIIIEQLAHGGITAQELSQVANIHVQSSRRILKELHEKKMIYICSWHCIKNHRIKLPMFKLGSRYDAPRPARLPKEVISQRYREKQKIKESFNPFYAICRNEETRAV